MILRDTLVTLIGGLLLGSSAFAEFNLTFKNHGQIQRQLSIGEMEKLSSSQSVTVESPVENKKHTYQAIPAQKLLDETLGPQWRRGDEILFTCQDGYQPSIPVQRFLDHTAWFAFKRNDQAAFSTVSSNGKKTIPLGPIYLVWENLKDSVIREEGEDGWPYQVVALDLIEFNKKFPKISPPENASSIEKRGFIAFRKYCLKCHAIDGEGGILGPELHSPVNVTDYFSEKWLKVWIKNPNQVRASSKMPPPLATIKVAKDQDQVATQIIAYLKSLKRKSIQK